MRTPVNRRSKAATVVFLATVLLLGFTQHPAASPQKDQQDVDRLAQIALADGTVGVIVHLQVPGIAALTAASTSLPGGDLGRAMAEQRESADVALKAAIARVSDRVVASLARTSFTVNYTYGTIPFMALRVGTDGLAALREMDDVIGIEEDAIVGVEPQPADASAEIADKPRLDVSVPLVGASTAWSWGFTGAGWYVAVLDTGVRTSHQMFSGKTIVEACYALGYDGVAGAGDCPNGSSSQTGTGSGAPQDSAYSGWNHGTHVAGIAVGNSSALAGVAKGANLIDVQVFSRFPSSYSSCGGTACVLTYTSDQISGLEYVYSLRGSYNIASINMSLGGGRYGSACDTDSRASIITNLRSAGIATAIATGNDGYCGYVGAPGCISQSVGVGATTDADAETSFNNWHATLQRLFAPGYSIYSASAASDSGYVNMSGTSMATPHVAGAWALLKHAVANGSVTDLLAALRNTGVAIASPCDSGQTPISRIRVDRAISSLSRYTLTIQATAFGTTSPVPGTYGYATGSTATVTATAATYATFTGWTGSATGTTNPATLTIDGNKTITANFQYIYPPSVAGYRVDNRSFSQREQIHVIKFGSNAANTGLTISYYRVYTIDGSTLTKLADVDASTDTYLHRQAGTAPITYAVMAVTNNGYEGAPATVTVQ
jgi:uncharacterized repeat protein (TIGR02543 family)